MTVFYMISGETEEENEEEEEIQAKQQSNPFPVCPFPEQAFVQEIFTITKEGQKSTNPVIRDISGKTLLVIFMPF